MEPNAQDITGTGIGSASNGQDLQSPITTATATATATATTTLTGTIRTPMMTTMKMTGSNSKQPD